jgi:GNAT superfamily N-acetyltransferase
MGMVFLRRLSRWQAETERAGVAELCAGATRESREEFTRRFVDHDVQQPGFDMVVAADPALVGYAYGFRTDGDGDWWRGFTDVPAEVREMTGGRQVFAVAGLLVAERRRREQVASRMLRELLARCDASLAIAVLEPGDAAARAAFHSWGWSKAGQLAPANSPPLDAWTRRLAA